MTLIEIIGNQQVRIHLLEEQLQSMVRLNQGLRKDADKLTAALKLVNDNPDTNPAVLEFVKGLETELAGEQPQPTPTPTPATDEAPDAEASAPEATQEQA
jgi:hypothetical protein